MVILIIKKLIFTISLTFMLAVSLNAAEELELPITPTLSATNFGMLSMEMIAEVFHRLDRQSLLKARKVCAPFKATIETHCLRLPENEDDLIQIIDHAPSGRIPEELKIPHWGNQDVEKSLLTGKRLFDLATKHYCSTYMYNMPEDRQASASNLDRYRMLMYVAYNLGVQEAFSQLDTLLFHFRDEIDDYRIHLLHCLPRVPTLEPMIHAHWWEQLASLDPSERSALALAYKGDQEKNKVVKDLERSTYWENYHCEYDFSKELFHIRAPL